MNPPRRKRPRAETPPADTSIVRRPVLSARHPRSSRVAVLEDRGSTLWLYLTERDGSSVACDVQVFSLDQAIAPQAASAQSELPLGGQWAFTWSEDGDAVAVMRDGKPVAFAGATRRVGFSRRLIEPGPAGVPWCETTFHELFGLHSDD